MKTGVRRSSAILVVGGLCLVLGSPPPVSGADRASPNPAEVVTATFIGGDGAEWLTAAAFPGNDTILLGGVSLDAELTLRGVKARVLGKDAPPLEACKAFRKLTTGAHQREDNEPKLDDMGAKSPSAAPSVDLDEVTPAQKEKQEREAREAAARLAAVPRNFQFVERHTNGTQVTCAKLSWLDSQATGFIACFDPQLRTVRSLVRFPRGSCAITSMAMASNGNVYVSGFADDRIKGASEDCREEQTNRFLTEPGFGGQRHAFLACLTPDLQKVVWLRQLKYRAYAPKLRVLRDGTITMLGPGYCQFSPDGKLLQATATRFTRVSSGAAVDPVTGIYTQVGDWLTQLGRGPMRIPRLFVTYSDGRTQKHLHSWDAPLFNPMFDNLVADSAVRRTAYDDDGNMVFSTWSHGGNSPMFRYPYDPERFMPISMQYGAGQTFCFVTKLNPEHEVMTSFFWTSAAFIDVLETACDRSVTWIGQCTEFDWMANTLSQDTDAPKLALAEPNLTGYRFYTSTPACGTKVVIAGCENKDMVWGIASGRCNGKPMIVYLTGACEQDVDLGVIKKPPLKDPTQKYGGGIMDGYALLLDLTPKAELGMELKVPRPPPPARPGTWPKPQPYKGKLVWPKEGQKWLTGVEKCVTVRVTFRDEKDKFWPSLFSGTGVPGGFFTYGTNTASADFILDAPGLQQTFGLQHQRVLGELTVVTQTVDQATGKIASSVVRDVTTKIHVTGMSPWEHTDVVRWDRQDMPFSKCKVSGTLEIVGLKVPFADAECWGWFRYPRLTQYNVESPNGAYVQADFPVMGKDIGLKSALAEEKLWVCARWEAVSPEAKITKISDPGVAAPPSMDEAPPAEKVAE